MERSVNKPDTRFDPWSSKQSEIGVGKGRGVETSTVEERSYRLRDERGWGIDVNPLN